MTSGVKPTRRQALATGAVTRLFDLGAAVDAQVAPIVFHRSVFRRLGA